tara:strand:- start:43 stop:402 length:360 start_codon:yes stop_codon:yes gene_type:complete
MNSNDNFKPIFKKKNKRRKPNIRLLIETIIMSFFGINLAIFLNTLPGKLVFIQYISDTWNDLAKGSILIFESLLNIGAVIIVILLILLCIVLIIGSISRIMILIRRTLKTNNKNRYINK